MRLDEVTDAIKQKEAKSVRLDEFVKVLRKQDGIIEEFDESLWACMAEHVEVSRNRELKFVFRDGTEIMV